MLICYHLLMNADPAGVQLCYQVIIMYEKQGTMEHMSVELRKNIWLFIYMA